MAAQKSDTQPPNPEAPKSEPRAPMRRSIRALLIGSLALNLIIVGLVAGAMLGNKRIGDRPPRDVDLIGAYSRALPQEDRRSLGKALRDHNRVSGFTRNAVQTTLRETLGALRADPFDADKLGVILRKQSSVAFERRDFAQDLLLKRLSAMSDAERLLVADRFEAALTKRPQKPRN
ncbi:MAG: periplasmic heavy metal sensor [Cognatishimia sp.]